MEISVAAGGQEHAVIVALDKDYPRSHPRLFLRNPPEFPSIPHLEKSGRFCILSPRLRYDRTDPVALVRHLIDGAIDILEKGLSGANQDDFRNEFLSYWNELVEGTRIRSILDPGPDSRRIRLWRGSLHDLAAEGPTEVRAWLRNRGKEHVADVLIEPSVLLWLPGPMLPSEYPTTFDELIHLAQSANGNGLQLLEQFLQTSSRQVVTVVIGAYASNAGCFAAVDLALRSKDRLNMRQFARSSPQDRLARWARASITKRQVERVDAYWIHGRDTNADVMTLQGSKIAVVGCGSLGGPLARQLALAGVGELQIIDPNALKWSNTGRHVLGAAYVGLNKAVSLASQLGREFPHSRFVGHDKHWQDAAEVFEGCDLVVSTIGLWDDEIELSLSRSEGGHLTVFGWTEIRGCASHALVIGPGTGCLGCGFNAAGDPDAEIAIWQDLPVAREAACGSWFMPYGADEAIEAATLISGLVLDALTGRAAPGAHRMKSARSVVLEVAGGGWSQWWQERANGRDPGGRTDEDRWAPKLGCAACGGKGVQ